MYAAVRTSIVWPEKVDDVIRLYGRWASQSTVSSSGFRGLLGLEDRGSGKGLAIALYESETDLDEGGRVSDELLANAGNLFAVPPMREVYEVFISTIREDTAGSTASRSFARLTTIRVRPESIDEVFETIRTSVVTTVERLRGYRGFIGLGDRATGKTMHITLWESESLLAAGESSGNYQNQVAKIAPFLVEPPVREVFEVAAS